MRKKIVLDSSVFLWRAGQSGLLYNWETAASLHVSLKDPFILSLFDQWQDLDNLYSAFYDDSDLQALPNPVEDIVRMKFGVVCDEKTPHVSFPPILKIRNSIEGKDKRGGLDAMPLLPNLSHLRIFLGGLSDGLLLWKQTMYPLSSSRHLAENRIVDFLQHCDLRSLSQIDLIVSDWNWDYLGALTKKLSALGVKKSVRFYFAHPDPGFNNEIIDYLVDEGYPLTQVCLHNADQETAPHITKNRNYLLLVRNEEDVKYWEDTFGEESVANYDLKPIADNNLAFFQKNIFLSKEEILSQKLSKKDIFRHQALNVNLFGTFYVFPDGTIHSAPDAPAIGTLEDSVHEIIIRELEENHAWRQTRDLMAPCKNCLYRYLCPSPSVFERIFGVPGCTYWKE